jgi:transposase
LPKKKKVENHKSKKTDNLQTYRLAILKKTVKQKTAKTDNSREIAQLYYMQGIPQKDIADKVGVTAQTICQWVKQGNWEAKRAGANVTRQELVNKSLFALNQILEQVYDTNDPELLAALPDKLAKFASAIEKLDKKSNIVTSMDSFMQFTSWLTERSSFDVQLTPELIRSITRYQDIYITEHIKIKT